MCGKCDGGHAALAGELLRALGAGLPLAAPAGPRGPLHLAAPADLTLEFPSAAGVLATNGTLAIPVTLHNRSARRETGTLLLCLPDDVFERPVSVAARSATTVICELPLVRLRAERGAGHRAGADGLRAIERAGRGGPLACRVLGLKLAKP